MLILIGIFVGLFVLIALATLISNHFAKKRHVENERATAINIPLDCCGAHEVCEVEEMLKDPEKVIYYEDEELDRFRGMQPEQYDARQIDEFRDVLYTLKEDEIKKWLISVDRRHIQLPSILKQEALMMLTE